MSDMAGRGRRKRDGGKPVRKKGKWVSLGEFGGYHVYPLFKPEDFAGASLKIVTKWAAKMVDAHGAFAEAYMTESRRHWPTFEQPGSEN